MDTGNYNYNLFTISFLASFPKHFPYFYIFTYGIYQLSEKEFIHKYGFSCFLQFVYDNFFYHSRNQLNINVFLHNFSVRKQVMRMSKKGNWILCPICGNKTRLQIRADTELKNFPLYCPKCRQESLIDAKNLQVTVIKEPDAQTQMPVL